MIRWLLILCLGIAMGCGKPKEPQPRGTDFESLMGKDLPQWKLVRTQADFENVAFFKQVYHQNIGLLEGDHPKYAIPKKLHWIWIGPKGFPLESVEYVRSWVAKHPDWSLYFWTDRERPAPHPALQVRRIQDLSWELEGLKECMNDSDNWAEKSDVLRLEILSSEGGIYVDHDVLCLKPFDPLVAAYDLFCGMEVPFKSALESSLLPTNNIVGSRPHHPLLRSCKEWLIAHWHEIGRAYPGTDTESVINRVSHRTFFAFGNAFKEGANKGGNSDIALPAFYFNAPKEEWGVFAQHRYAGTWFDQESKFEKGVRARLMYLSKKANRAILYVVVSTLINLVGFTCLGLLIAKRKKG